MRKLEEKDHIGKKYNFLVVIRITSLDKNKTKALFRCNCGTEKELYLSQVKQGRPKSCGCLIAVGGNRKHGLKKHPIYHVWECMKRRCYAKTDLAFCRYGGRGITVCDEWKTNFKVFYDWAILSGWSPGLQIDRINNNEGYSPNNCRFVTSKENCRNRSSNVIITYKGKTMLMSDWALALGLSISGFHKRLKRMTPEQAIEMPKKLVH